MDALWIPAQAIFAVEMCMGMGKTGIPWDSYGNGNKIRRGMGTGRECELRHGSVKKNPAYCN